jgi:hypothetical protein
MPRLNSVGIGSPSRYRCSSPTTRYLHVQDLATFELWLILSPLAMVSPDLLDPYGILPGATTQNSGPINEANVSRSLRRLKDGEQEYITADGCSATIKREARLF